MSAKDVLEIARNRGIKLRVKDENIVYKCPPGAMDTELRSLIAKHKDELIEMLRLKPFIDDQGRLIIPFDSDPRYHWWSCGQPIAETLRELGAPAEVLIRNDTKKGDKLWQLKRNQKPLP